MLIYLLVLDGVFDIGLASLTDVIGIANELALMEGTPARLDMKLVGVRRRVRTAQGLAVPVVLASGLPPPDIVLVPAIGAKLPGQLTLALAQRDVADAGACLTRWAASGASLGAACTGTFILAEAGLLNGRRATTSWWLSALFRQRYPLVDVDDSSMLVNSGVFTTAGAALGHLDLGLGVVRQWSPHIAALCGRYLLIESRTSQSVFVIPDHVAHSDPIVERFEQWARGRLAEGFSMREVTSAIGASDRTLNRRLQTVLGKSPLAYFQDLRVERAVHLLQTSSESMERIANQVGYADATTLRALLRRKLGKGVRELRRNREKSSQTTKLA
jgi:transcriptional regulator GlxA family with amidase domain